MGNCRVATAFELVCRRGVEAADIPGEDWFGPASPSCGIRPAGREAEVAWAEHPVGPGRDGLGRVGRLDGARARGWRASAR